MSEITIIIVVAIALFILWLLFRKKKPERYISEETKRKVLERYYNMCAVCDFDKRELIEYHHRKKFSQEGDNSEKNIVPLCPNHHQLITRYGDKTTK